MLKKLKDTFSTVYHYIEERYSILAILAFIFVGVAIVEIIIYFILDYFVTNSLVRSYISLGIYLSVFVITTAIWILALLGIQDKERNSIFAYLALLGSAIPLIFLWYQNYLLALLSIAISIIFIALMTVKMLQKIVIWSLGALFLLSIIFYVATNLNGMKIEQFLWSKEEQVYYETLNLKLPKEVEDLELKIVDNSEFYLWGRVDRKYYFSYKTEIGYFNYLVPKIKKVPCEYGNRNLVLCYRGFVNGFNHSLTYNTLTKKVQHEVSNE